MTKIDSLTIKPLTSGFLMDVQFDGADEPAEHAYSDFEDLANALALLLGPAPQIIGMDMAESGSDKSMLGLVGADGLTETLDPDDGWREWDGYLPPGKDFPPGVEAHYMVDVRTRVSGRLSDNVPALALRWFWGGDSGYDPDSDIVAYRVVKP